MIDRRRLGFGWFDDDRLTCPKCWGYAVAFAGWLVFVVFLTGGIAP